MIPKERTYPVFESNQVLTNRHLNDLFEFLDEQNRLTRTNLVGIGIVCGLKFSVAADSSSITVTKGCGVTSEGYLAVIPDDPTTTTPDSVKLEGWKVYKAPADVAYPVFNMLPGGKQVDLWELFPDGEPEAKPLNPKFLQDKVLLLFVECNRENLKTCSPNSCDDKGQEVTVTLRKLLIFRNDLDKIIAAVGNNAAHPGGELNARLALPDLRLRRFDVEFSGVDTAMEIFLAYRSILFEPQANGDVTLFQSVGSALSKAYKAFLPLVVSEEPTDPFADHLADIQTRYDTGFFTNQIIFSQYYYDFIGDLIAAYDEFRGKGLELMALCCPASDLFPRHLMLGELSGSGIAGKKVYRHYFQPSQVQLQQAALAAEVRQLFRRLVGMVRNFELPSFPQRASSLQLVRITPSRYGPFRLSQKAIPFYFKVNDGSPALFEQWSYKKTKVGKAAHNLSYHADKYPSPEFVRQALRYDLEPNNFFRIEGGVGLAWRDVVKDLLDKIRRFRLPFDVIALNADNFAVSKDPQPAHCLDNDLDVIYRSWMNEAKCLFEKKVGFFSSFDLATNKFTRVAALRTSAAKAATGTISKAVTAPGDLRLERDAGTFSRGPVAGSLKTHTSGFTFFDVNDAVFTTSGSIGEVLKPNLEAKPGGVKATDLLAATNEALRDNDSVKNLSKQDYSLVVESPVKLIGAIAELSDAIPDDSAELDFTLVKARYDGLRFAASEYLNDLILLPDDFVFIPPSEKDKAVAELKNLLDNCLDERLDELSAEIQRRKKAAVEAIFFSNYVKKHPDIQHKAGVPTGGTFILIFRETPNTPTPVTPGTSGPGIFVGDAVLPNNPNVIGGLLRSDVTDNSAAKDFTATPATTFERKRLSNVQAQILSSAFTNAGLQFDFGGLLDAGVFEVNPEVVTTRPPEIQIPEGVVIADFFLPYRCCSDCPPVQFILPPPRPSFTATPGCPNDAGTAPVSINVISGERPFELKIGEAADAPFSPLDPAQPLDLAVGKHILVLRDSQGGESLPVAVEITPRMQLDPGEIICSETGDTYNLRIFVANGKAPFFVNGKPPLNVEVVNGAHQLLAGPFPGGQNLTIEVKDSSGCPPQSFQSEDPKCLPQPPVANANAAATAFNTPVTINVLANDTGTNLKVSIPTQSVEGTATANADGTITFTPSPTVSGKPVTFQYQVTDSAGQSAQAAVVVQVGAKPCNLPCDGMAERCRYPMWLSKPQGEMIYRFTEVANLTITDTQTGKVIFKEELRGIFNEVLPNGTVLTNTNYNGVFKKLFDRIQQLVSAKLGDDVFTMDNNDANHGGTLAIEHFVCHTFTFDVLFGAIQSPGQTNVQARWIYDENGVIVQQQQPAGANFKVAKFGCDQIDKCALPRTVKETGRVKITKFQRQNRRLTAITEPKVNLAGSRFNWLVEWSKAPFASEVDEIKPELIPENSGKARLIVVDKDGKWDYFEDFFNLGGGVNPTGGTTNPTTGGTTVPPIITGGGPTIPPVIVIGGGVRPPGRTAGGGRGRTVAQPKKAKPTKPKKGGKK